MRTRCEEWDVRDTGEYSRTGEEEGEDGNGVRDRPDSRAVQSVPTLANEDRSLLQEGGDPTDRHKSKEGDGKKVHAETILNLVRRGAKSDPDRREKETHRSVHPHCIEQGVRDRSSEGRERRESHFEFQRRECCDCTAESSSE